MKRIDAKNIYKTMSWLMDKEGDDSSVMQTSKNSAGLYECKIYLPLIDKTVIGIGELKIDAIDNATKQTVKLIDDYLKSHPEEKFKNIFTLPCQILEMDDNGDYQLYIGIDELKDM